MKENTMYRGSVLDQTLQAPWASLLLAEVLKHENTRDVLHTFSV